MWFLSGQQIEMYGSGVSLFGGHFFHNMFWYIFFEIRKPFGMYVSSACAKPESEAPATEQARAWKKFRLLSRDQIANGSEAQAQIRRLSSLPPMLQSFSACRTPLSPRDARAKAEPANLVRDPTQAVVGTGVPPPSKGVETGQETSVRFGRAGIETEREEEENSVDGNGRLTAPSALSSPAPAKHYDACPPFRRNHARLFIPQ
jgi:hypothetical protein